MSFDLQLIIESLPVMLMGIGKTCQNFYQFCKLQCTHLVKTLNFYNMLLAAKYAPRKNLEKMKRVNFEYQFTTFLRQFRANFRANFTHRIFRGFYEVRTSQLKACCKIQSFYEVRT